MVHRSGLARGGRRKEPKAMSIKDVRAHLAKHPAPEALDAQRAQYDKAERFFKLPADVTVEPVRVAGLPAEWLRPAGARADATVLYLHGGGYAIGSVKSHRHLTAAIARAAGVRALLVDYRRAPEADIEQHHVRHRLHQGPKGRRSVRNRAGGVAVRLEQLLEHPADLRVVVTSRGTPHPLRGDSRRGASRHAAR
ncbi:MAG: alpha/beta hydrolase [candidate division NC10 bacterium]|nr:alpha/beta hydrolase [candidate division NC10 bacterium]